MTSISSGHTLFHLGWVLDQSASPSRAPQLHHTSSAVWARLSQHGHIVCIQTPPSFSILPPFTPLAPCTNLVADSDGTLQRQYRDGLVPPPGRLWRYLHLHQPFTCHPAIVNKLGSRIQVSGKCGRILNPTSVRDHNVQAYIVYTCTCSSV